MFKFRLGGSVLAYIVVGVVLVGSLGLFLRSAYQRGSDIRSDTPLFEVTEEATPQPNTATETKPNTQKPVTDEGSKTSQKKSSHEEKKTEELPVTGVGDTIVKVIAVLGLSFSVSSYVMSRIRVRTL